MKFILNGCDISFIAEAPEDITLKQLLKQCDKIKPDWCACGICSYEKEYKSECCHQKFFEYNDKIYSVTMRNGEVLVVCEVNYYNYSVEALSNKRGDI